MDEEKKKYLRKYALEKRNSLQIDKSAEIVKKILNSGEFKKAKNIAVYYPVLNEIDLRDLFKCKDKNFYLPRCNSDQLEFAPYNGNKNLKPGKFNILEPIGDKINPEILDLIYIPALMANRKGYRLGYGKGYYDKFLTNLQHELVKCIVISKEFISDEFIEDEFDYCCDKIISA